MAHVTRLATGKRRKSVRSRLPQNGDIPRP